MQVHGRGRWRSALRLDVGRSTQPAEVDRVGEGYAAVVIVASAAAA
jgi:hypothetical protein